VVGRVGGRGDRQARRGHGERVVGADRVGEVEVAAVVPGAARVDALPDPGAGAGDGGRPAVDDGGVGERDRQRRPGEVGDQPLFLSRRTGQQVDGDLQRRGEAHHPPAVRPEPVEFPLHGEVARSGRAERYLGAGVVRVGADRFEPHTAPVRDRRRPGQQPVHLVEQAGHGTARWRAQLQLAARLERGSCRGDEAGVEALGQYRGIDRLRRVGTGHRDQLDLDTDPAGPACRCEQPPYRLLKVHGPTVAEPGCGHISAGTQTQYCNAVPMRILTAWRARSGSSAGRRSWACCAGGWPTPAPARVAWF